MLPKNVQEKIEEAIMLVRRTPGYSGIAQELAQLLADGNICYHAGLEDRAHAGLLGTITLGAEPFAPEGTVLGLAETLVHERFHLHQNPLLKTASFWTGIVTRADPMIAYERPAYQAAAQFLEVYRAAHPAGADEADAELVAVRDTFESSYGEALS
ncbi:MAG: hypothetical protein H7Y38_14550 [Armatimonadetes bacterium]|nr:hypothetical protein [Armatimonadota bacterium]